MGAAIFAEKSDDEKLPAVLERNLFSATHGDSNLAEKPMIKIPNDKKKNSLINEPQVLMYPLQQHTNHCHNAYGYLIYVTHAISWSADQTVCCIYNGRCFDDSAYEKLQFILQRRNIFEKLYMIERSHLKTF